MDKRLISAFHWQINAQCDFVQIAALGMNRALSAEATLEFFFYAQSFLGAAGNIYKALWGSKEREKRGRLALRESLGIEAASSLDNKTRNKWEHFDRELESWYKHSPRHNLIDMNILFPDSMVGFSETDMMRAYDPVTSTLSILDGRINVQAVVIEVARISQAVKVELQILPRESASRPPISG